MPTETQISDATSKIQTLIMAKYETTLKRNELNRLNIKSVNEKLEKFKKELKTRIIRTKYFPYSKSSIVSAVRRCDIQTIWNTKLNCYDNWVILKFENMEISYDAKLLKYCHVYEICELSKLIEDLEKSKRSLDALTEKYCEEQEILKKILNRPISRISRHIRATWTPSDSKELMPAQRANTIMRSYIDPIIQTKSTSCNA